MQYFKNFKYFYVKFSQKVQILQIIKVYQILCTHKILRGE